jgi:PAS domain S-box-containing protein
MPLSAEAFVAAIPGLWALTDSQLRCRAASAGLAKLLERREMPSLLSGFTPASRQGIGDALHALSTTGEGVSGLAVEYGNPSRPARGQIDAWLAGTQDTELLLAVRVTPASRTDALAAQLRLLSDRNEMILNAVGDGVYGLDENGLTTFVNPAAAELLGWEPDDIVGKPLHDVHHHSHADGTPYPREHCPIYASLRDHVVHRVDNEVFWSADGEAIPVEYVATPILRDGAVRGAVVVFRDIRKRRAAEQARDDAYTELESVKRRLELILEAAGDGIYGIDRDGNGTFANRAAVELLGWRLEDVVGHGVHELHHHSHADGSVYPREDCPVYAAITDGEVHRVDDEVFWSRDGSACRVEYTSTPILTGDGTPDGAVVVFRDVSDRKRLERERDTAFAEVRELNRQLEQERNYLREEVELTVNFGEIIGESPALRRTLAQIDAVAATPVNVLVLGESGVGKEMIARAIHAASDRSELPLVKVNCASIPKELFESEFFGHVKGAFTGAHRDRVGRMQLADGGTLFLDEVGEIPLSLQGKLLRALQEGEFERVGDDHTLSVDVRIVAATNRNLAAEVEAGRFREDLYYRLSVFPIEVPPLRERRADIAPLAVHFVNRFCRDIGREPPAISKRQARLLEAQRWPGNIRELRNVMERAVILSRGKRLELDLETGDSGVPAQAISAADDDDFMTDSELRELEKRNLVAALRRADWRVSGPGGAADLLGIKPSTLAYRMKAFGVSAERPARS